MLGNAVHLDLGFEIRSFESYVHFVQISSTFGSSMPAFIKHKNNENYALRMCEYQFNGVNLYK